MSEILSGLFNRDLRYIEIDVTSSGKRDIFAHTMIVQYKHCSKTRNIFYSLKKVSTTLCLHSRQI